jgi:hypothetical protein
MNTWLPAVAPIIVALIYTTPKILAEIRKFRDDRKEE